MMLLPYHELWYFLAQSAGRPRTSTPRAAADPPLPHQTPEAQICAPCSKYVTENRPDRSVLGGSRHCGESPPAPRQCATNAYPAAPDLLATALSAPDIASASAAKMSSRPVLDQPSLGSNRKANQGRRGGSFILPIHHRCRAIRGHRLIPCR